MHDIIIYVAQWWEKYISKRSLIKHIFSSSKELYMTRSNFKVAVPSIVFRQSLIISKNSFILGQLFLKKTAHKYFSSVPRTMWFIRLLYIISPLFFWREVVLFACFTKRNSKRISEILQWMIDADVRELCRRVTELKFFFEVI